MPKKTELKEIQKQKMWYYIDEISILILTFIAVMASDVIGYMAKNGMDSVVTITFNWPQVAISGLLSVVVYGMIHSKFEYNDKQKPPWIKRASVAIMQGIAWRTVVGWSK